MKVIKPLLVLCACSPVCSHFFYAAAQSDAPTIRTDSITSPDHRSAEIRLPPELEANFEPRTSPANDISLFGSKNITDRYLPNMQRGIRLFDQPNISLYGTKRSNFFAHPQAAGIHELSKTLNFDYRLTNNLTFNASGMIGYTSQPLSILPQHSCNVYAGLTYTPTEKLTLGTGVNMGMFVNSSYTNTSMFAQYRMNEHWTANAYGGIFLSKSAIDPNFKSSSMMGGLQMTYTADNGLFMYGRGFAAMNSGNYTPYTRDPFAYNTGVGAGLGFNLPDAGPISIGVDWIRNPSTGRMEPIANINIFGGIVYLIKKIVEAFEGDSSYSTIGYKKPLKEVKPLTH